MRLSIPVAVNVDDDETAYMWQSLQGQGQIDLEEEIEEEFAR